MVNVRTLTLGISRRSSIHASNTDYPHCIDTHNSIHIYACSRNAVTLRDFLSAQLDMALISSIIATILRLIPWNLLVIALFIVWAVKKIWARFYPVYTEFMSSINTIICVTKYISSFGADGIGRITNVGADAYHGAENVFDNIGGAFGSLF